MHVENIVQELLQRTIHQTRVTSLIPVIIGIINSKTLKLSTLEDSDLLLI